ncbi:MAG TPA: hypothetical protein VGL36_35795 [Kribbella sp.]
MSGVADTPRPVNVREVAFAIALSSVPGTEMERLGQQMADHIGQLPAAAMIGQIDVPADIAAAVRSQTGLRDLASSAADFLVFFVRLYYARDKDLPNDALETAIAARELWERHLTGTASGLLGVAVVPGLDPRRLPDVALHTPWIVVTSNAPPGLLPGGID